MEWRPLLDGADAEAAWRTIDAIAAELTEIKLGESGSLAGGAAGAALFYAYLASSREGLGHDETAARLVEAAHEAVASDPHQSISLYSGFPGVAWVTEHVSGEPQESADEALALLLSPEPWQGPYELIQGLAGAGLYALSAQASSPREGAARLIERCVRATLGLVREQQGELVLWTPPEEIYWKTRPSYPRGWENHGVSHGSTGAIAFLAQAVASGALDQTLAARAREAATGLLRRLISHAIPGPARYPAWVVPEQASSPSRNAWCYGDAGVAAALLVAGRALGDDAIVAEALTTARLSAARGLEASGVVDAAICHGSAGLASLLARLYFESGEEPLAEAARLWWRDALARRRPGEGVAGYLAVLAEARVADPSWLTGAAGIGLSLLSAVTPIAPAWDAVLCASPCAQAAVTEA